LRNRTIASSDTGSTGITSRIASIRVNGIRFRSSKKDWFFGDSISN